MKMFRRISIVLVLTACPTAAWAVTACPSNAVCVNALATGGTGTAASPWTGWETATNGIPTYTHVHFPAGYYAQVLEIRMQKGWLVTGDGSLSESPAGTGGATYILSTFAGTAFYYLGLGNQDPSGIRIEHLTIANSNPSNLGSAIITRLTSVVHISHV